MNAAVMALAIPTVHANALPTGVGPIVVPGLLLISLLYCFVVLCFI